MPRPSHMTAVSSWSRPRAVVFGPTPPGLLRRGLTFWARLCFLPSRSPCPSCWAPPLAVGPFGLLGPLELNAAWLGPCLARRSTFLSAACVPHSTCSTWSFPGCDTYSKTHPGATHAAPALAKAVTCASSGDNVRDTTTRCGVCRGAPELVRVEVTCK